jgi:hypothetical protein
MSGYLSTLLARTFEPAGNLRPMLPSLFGAPAELAASPLELEQEVELTQKAPRSVPLPAAHPVTPLPVASADRKPAPPPDPERPGVHKSPAEPDTIPPSTFEIPAIRRPEPSAAPPDQEPPPTPRLAVGQFRPKSPASIEPAKRHPASAPEVPAAVERAAAVVPPAHPGRREEPAMQLPSRPPWPESQRHELIIDSESFSSPRPPLPSPPVQPAVPRRGVRPVAGEMIKATSKRPQPEVPLQLRAVRDVRIDSPRRGTGSEPVIAVTIGRIEVRAPASTPRAASPRVSSPAVPLEKYLRDRSGRGAL